MKLNSSDDGNGRRKINFNPLSLESSSLRTPSFDTTISCHRHRRPKSFSSLLLYRRPSKSRMALKSLLINTFILSFLLVSLFVIRVGLYNDYSSSSSSYIYHGTQVSTMSTSSDDNLYWIDDDNFIYYDKIIPGHQRSLSGQEKYRERLKRLFKNRKNKPGLKGSKVFEQRYSVIFDAGSTGSRVSIVVFNVTSMPDTKTNSGSTEVGGGGDDETIILDKTYFAQVKPGLSSFADNISAAAKSLDPLLSLVTSVITDKELIKKTPLLLKATAGLRLLPGETADLILASVKEYLTSNYNFMINDDSVSILDGDSEGIYSWMTINTLLGHIGSQEEDDNDIKDGDVDQLNQAINSKSGLIDTLNSVAVLDLGGGSAQVTFTPVIDEYINHLMIATSSSSPGDEFIIKKKIGNSESVKLYTHSYLGYGLMSARKAMLNMVIKDSAGGATSNATDVYVSHPCFRSSIGSYNDELIVWKFDGITYHINSSSTATINNENLNCYDLASKYVTYPADGAAGNDGDSSGSHGDSMLVQRRAIDNPRELNVRNIYAISYFYDRAVDVGLINDPLIRHSVIKVKKFVSAAKKFCKKLSDTINVDLLNSRYLRKRVRNSAKLVFDTIDETFGNGEEVKRDPFLCLDLSYIAAFLKDGLELNMNKDLHVANQVNGVEASWSLGAAYDLMYTSMSSPDGPVNQENTN